MISEEKKIGLCATAPDPKVMTDQVVPYRFGTGDIRDVHTYDSMRYSGSTGQYKQQTMGKVYRGLLGSLKDKVVLDLACGTGRGAIDFASVASSVVGCDASTDMLSAAKSKPADRTNIAFVCGLAQAIPFPDELFDIVVSLNFLHLFRPPSQRVFVKEMIRVLRPGGILLLEFDNALHAFGLGLLKRWLGGEPGSLPSEIRGVVPSGSRIIKVQGALIPYFWRWLGEISFAIELLRSICWAAPHQQAPLPSYIRDDRENRSGILMGAPCQVSALSVLLPESGTHLRGATLEPVRRHLLAHGREYFPSLSDGLSVRTEPVRRPSTNPLYRFMVSDACRNFRVIAKRAPVYPDNNEGETEFLHYRSFRALYGSDAPFRCPTPVAFLSSENVLLTEESNGACLRNLLRSSRFSSGQNHFATMRLLAKWLRGFHELKPSKDIPLSSAWGLIEKAAPWIKNRFFTDDGLSDVLTPQMCRRIRELRQALRASSSPCRIGPVHRDFGPGNVIVSTKHVVVCDAAYNQSGPQLVDIADFVAYLRLVPILSLRTDSTYRALTNTIYNVILRPLQSELGRNSTSGTAHFSRSGKKSKPPLAPDSDEGAAVAICREFVLPTALPRRF